MRELELVDGFSLANCQACAAASAEAYSEPPTIQSALAHVRVEDCGNAILVAFRGTADPLDWITDIEAWYSQASDLHSGSMVPGRIHHGFARAFESIAAQLSCLALVAAGDKPVILTGHSLGGALAQLFASWWGGNLDSVYTFGGPRVGDRAWADHYNAIRELCPGPQLGERTFRVVNQVDIIARAPGLLAGYRHTGIEVLLTPSWSLWLSPPWWLQLWADVSAIYSDLHSRRLGVLLDHHVGLYCQRIGAQSSDSTLRTPHSALRT